MTNVQAVANRRLVAEDDHLPAVAQRKGSYGIILKAALRLFAERGFGATSVRELAAAAGVQPATLYAHFPSKDHVLAELIRIGHEELFNRLRAALLASQPDPKEQIAALVRAHISVQTEFPTLAVVANNEMHVCAPELIADSVALRLRCEQMLLEVARRGIETGVFKVPHPWIALAVIGGAGLRVSHWYTPEFELKPEQVADIYAQYAWRILGVTE